MQKMEAALLAEYYESNYGIRISLTLNFVFKHKTKVSSMQYTQLLKRTYYIYERIEKSV